MIAISVPINNFENGEKLGYSLRVGGSPPGSASPIEKSLQLFADSIKKLMSFNLKAFPAELAESRNRE